MKTVSFEYGINCTSNYIFQFILTLETFLYENFFKIENEKYEQMYFYKEGYIRYNTDRD